MRGLIVSFTRCRRGATALEYAALICVFSVTGYIAYDGLIQGGLHKAQQANRVIDARWRDAMNPPAAKNSRIIVRTEPAKPDDPGCEIERRFAPAAGEEKRTRSSPLLP